MVPSRPDSDADVAACRAESVRHSLAIQLMSRKQKTEGRTWALFSPPEYGHLKLALYAPLTKVGRLLSGAQLGPGPLYLGLRDVSGPAAELALTEGSVSK